MEINYNYDIVNTESRKSVSKKYENNEKWINYARRAQTNPYNKKFLLEKYDYICQYCGLPIKDKYVLQHITYDNECITEETIRVNSSTLSNPFKTRKVPNCKQCERFSDCIENNLVPVHIGCNYKISKETYKIMRGKRNK